MRANLNQTAFTGGEWSPRAHGRTDFDRYGTALKQCRNAYPVQQGGARRRPGTRYLMDAATVTASRSILIPFIGGRASAFMVEFGESACRILAADGSDLGVTLAAPYAASSLGSLDWAQADNTMWLFHPGYPVQRLQLLDGGAWVLSPAPFTQAPYAEAGLLVTTANAVLSDTSVGAGRTLQAASAVFLASDVGRGVISQSGLAVITGYTSATLVTVEITRAFPSSLLAVGQWTIDISPQAECTPGAKDPVGATTTLALDIAGWRPGDVGSIVRINGGLLRISAYSSATSVSAVILRELSATVPAQALAWSLEPSIWSSARGYPRTGTVHQQRLICAGTAKYPRTVWGSRLGETLDFLRGTNDDDGFSFTMDGDESSPIAFVSSNKDLAVFTESAEVTMRGGVEKPLTPTNVRVNADSNVGCAAVRPVTVGREIMFVQRGGTRLRGYGYRYDFDAYSSVDLSALAEHLPKVGIVWAAYQRLPDPIIWCVTADGALLSCTFDRDQQPAVVAWARHDTQGVIECCAVLHQDSSEYLWMIVRRTINGEVQRYIERMEHTWSPFHPSSDSDGRDYGYTADCAIVVDAVPGVSSVEAPHLAGSVVDVLGDATDLGKRSVGGTTVTLPRSAKRVLVGLPFVSRIMPMQPDVATASGSSQSQAARTGQVTMRFLDTISARVESVDRGEVKSSQELPFRQLGVGVLDQAPEMFTGLYPVSLLGWDRGEADVTIVQYKPYPMHLLGIVRRHTVNGG
jgi:hypothetical protein